jgi:hypothetical protein
MEELVDIKKQPQESPFDFLKRCADFLEVSLPANIDFTELQ